MTESIDHPQPSAQSALIRWFVLIGATFAILVGSFVWLSRSWTVDSAAAAAEGTGAPAISYPEPDFRLASLDGRTIGPPDFAGQVVVIDFWATWCGPCKLQAQFLDRLHEEVGSRVQFLAIDVGEEEDRVRGYVDKDPFPYPVLLDPEEELMDRYQILGLPTVMVIDREGRVSYMRTGLTDVPTLRRQLAKAGAEV